MIRFKMLVLTSNGLKLEPSNGFQLDSKNVNNITVALNQRTIWPEEQESKGFFDSIASLKLYSNGYNCSSRVICSERLYNDFSI